MPRKAKKGHVRGLGDVTLNDFANSSTPKSRTKKSSNNVTVVVKKEVEKSWEDKDEDDFEGEFVPQENEDGTVSFVIQKVESRTRKKTSSTSSRGNSKEQEEGRDYPIDIWYILSDYIKPEDVGTFAAICKTSFEVVCTSKFWFGLYRRYYKNILNMPETLQPESLIRKYGLKRNVIRALYYMYQPFVNRIKPVTIFEEHPDSLKNYECQLFWFEKKNALYIYFLKMKRKTLRSLSHSSGTSQVPDLLEILDDVSANPDEHCRVLEVTCMHFYPIQAIMGLTLKYVSLTLSSAPKFRYHRLQLIFGSMISSPSSSRGGADSITVILDPVSNIKVLDWWHPLYPVGNSNMSHDLLRNQD